MAPLQVANLSSNWKKLQQTLKPKAQPSDADNSSAGSVKRKRIIESQDEKFKKRYRGKIALESTNASKRLKTDLSYNPERKNKPKPKTGNNMGTAPSKTPPNSESTAPASTTTAPSSTTPTSTTPAPATVETTVIASSPPDTLLNQGLHPTHKPGKYLAIDCEMVGSGPLDDNILARVSIVNFHGEQIYDSFVQPVKGVQVTDYRTFVSGIRPHHLHPDTARPFAQVQKEVAALLNGKILIGHAIKNDLNVLLLSHPSRDIRDTARHAKFRQSSMGRAPALRKLAKEFLGTDIQGGEHSSVEDARATMQLFKLEKDAFEKEVKQKYGAAIRKEEKMKQQQEDKKARKEEARQMKEDADENEDSDEEEDESDNDDDEQLDNNGNVIAPAVKKSKKSKKKKKKSKKRTKRA
jgi:RNA exonuclease 4